MLDYQPLIHHQGIIVITALHAKRNRTYLRTVVFVLLVCLVSLGISATCTMPIPSVLTTMPEHMPGCPDIDATAEPGQADAANAMQDCAFKPCLDSQADSLTDFNRLAKADLPIFILGVIGTFLYLFPNYPPAKVPFQAAPPSGRRIALIYWFCTLLN